MKKYNDILIRQNDAANSTDGSDNVQPATKVWITLAGTRTIVDLYDGSDITTANKIDNPITTDDYGRMSFYVADGDYDFYINLNTDIEFKVKSNEPIYDVTRLVLEDVKIFESLAALKLSNSVKVGQYVKTLGYNSAGDGGGNTYMLQSSGTPDKGSVVSLDASGLYAVGLFLDRVARAEQFGAFGDGVTIEKDNLVDLFKFQNVDCYKLKSGATYNLGTVSSDNKMFEIKNREHFKVIGSGTEIKCESVHSGSPWNVIFWLEDTNNIDLDIGCDGVSFNRDTGYSGTELVFIQNQARSTSNLKLNLRCKNIARAVGSSSSNPALYRTGGVVSINSVCNSGYYNVNLANNVDNLVGSINSYNMVRSYFVYGVTNHNVKVTSSSHYKFTDCLIKSYTFPTTNIKVKYILSTSQSVDAVCTVEHQGDTQNGVIKNIEFDVDISGHSNTYQFTISQFNNAGALQATTDSVITNIKYKGQINGRSISSQNFNITVSPTNPSLIFVEAGVNPMFADTKGFSVFSNGRLIRAHEGDINGDHYIPVGFLSGAGWGAQMRVFAIEDQSNVSAASTSKVYNLLGYTVSPSPSVITSHDVISDVNSPTPPTMVITPIAGVFNGHSSVGVNISGQPGSVTGNVFIELEFTGQRIFDGW